MPGLFCFGMGFSARQIAAQLRDEGWHIAGTTRSADKAGRLKAEGITPYVFDDDRPVADIRAALAGITHILVSVPPGGDGDPVLAHHGGDLAALLPAGCWIGYLSTTGVYGDRDGAVVTEDDDLLPGGKRGRRRVAAEKAWFDLGRRHDLAVHSFRLAGIYGPGRNALETVMAGRARRIIKPGQVFSRIHVDDIANVVLASIRRPDAGAAYNVCDDDAAPPQDVIAFACGLLGVAPPPDEDCATARLSPMAASFYEDNKRVANDRIKQDLAVTLRHPDYRSGLMALFDDIVKRSGNGETGAKLT
ncbi:SDR family oxidoreductase [Thalassospira sp.]|uniref:SDR family oxidoreductase n=1 Tax=Thalassospira sp. TaxID=1912094 RepID=UPI002735DC76|nr:SDR family oxidoreductase [Thalassospira sp.]MDP2699405.1 SDR family oxidoreductase [Thalassospira sp.]